VRILVAVISTLRSLRFRLFFIIFLVLFSIGFQTAYLLTTAELQDNIETTGNDYIDQDTLIIDDLNRMLTLLEDMQSQHITSLLSNLFFRDSLDAETGEDTLSDFRDLTVGSSDGLIPGMETLLEEREAEGYLIEAEINNPLYATLASFQDPRFGGYEEEDPIIERGDNSSLGLYNEFTNQTLFETRFTFFDDPTSPGDVISLTIVDYVIDEIVTQSNAIRAFHNNRMSVLRNNTETTEAGEGVFAIIQHLQEHIVEVLSESNNQTRVFELSTKLLEGDRLVNSYITSITRFENLVLSNSLISQSEKTSEINSFVTDLVASSEEINAQFNSVSSDLNNSDTVEAEIADLLDIVLVGFNNSHSFANQTLINNGIVLGQFIEDARLTINNIIQILMAEQTRFEDGFDKLVADLQDDLAINTLYVSIIIILVTFVTVGSVTFSLIRHFTRYQNNYKMVEEGNLDIRLKKNYSQNEIGRVDKGFDDMIVELKRILSALQRSSERMAGIAEELAAGSEEASASVQEVSNTVREFSAGAAEQNLMLNRVDDKLSDHLKTIEEATRQINETSNFVLKVAKRTNILGLNASIEAAKAGRFGLGFNVVAEEVRNLSDDTKTSALEIAELIENIETRIQNTVRDILNEVNITKDVAENTAAGSEEANAATSEQVVMLNEISQTSNELSLLANELQEILARFKL
jgi:methyl-accepting chemotaxis protein